jgi:bifunctional DNA-binding transcriptional regulator/antitoxin component of YhaV-PrlF toxin-antitoxin module
LPKAVRDHLKLETGQRVEFLIGDDGTVTVWPVTADVTSLKTILPPPKHTLTLDEIDKVIRERAIRE